MISMERNSEKGWQGTTLNTMCSLIPWPPQGWVPAWGKKRKLGRKVFEVLHERRQGKELEVVHEYHHQHGREHKMNRRPDEKNCKQRTESWIDYTQCINIHRLIMHTVQSQTLFPSVNIWSSIFLKSLTKALFWYRWMPTLLFSILVVGIGGWVSHRWKSRRNETPPSPGLCLECLCFRRVLVGYMNTEV